MTIISITSLLWLSLFLGGIALLYSTIMRASVHYGGQPQHIAKATYSYSMQMLGLLLMALGLLPTLYGTMAPLSFNSAQHLCMLIIFFVGLILYLRHDAIADTIDYRSRTIPMLLYLYILRTIGVLLGIISILSLATVCILHRSDVLWYVPSLVLLLSVSLLWVAKATELRVPNSQTATTIKGQKRTKK